MKIFQEISKSKFYELEIILKDNAIESFVLKLYDNISNIMVLEKHFKVNFFIPQNKEYFLKEFEFFDKTNCVYDLKSFLENVTAEGFQIFVEK